MTLLANPQSIGNIEDAEAFVRHCIAKGGIMLTADERDELIAEGLALLVELHRKYEPERDKGGAGQTRGFFGYALYLLPRKLSDAWHRSQPHHLQRTQPDGSRKYVYLTPARSLEERHETHHGERDTRMLDDSRWRTPGDFVSVLGDAA